MFDDERMEETYAFKLRVSFNNEVYIVRSDRG